jgi:tol-pal system protein YbgF
MRLGRSRHLHPKTCVLLLLPMLVGCATVAEHRKLERRVDGMQRGGIQTGGDERARVADLAARLDSIEGELQRLSGRLDVAEHASQEALEQARAARTAAGSVVPPATTDAGSAAPAPEGGGGGASADEVRAYRGAWAAWSRGEAEVCIDQFREFLQTYASSTYAENASYWMADCYFKRGDYKTAILRFDDVVVRYPTGERAPDALYRTGEALLRLGPGYGKAAGKAFERVIDEYPSSGRVEEARKQLDLLGSGRAG